MPQLMDAPATRLRSPGPAGGQPFRTFRGEPESIAGLRLMRGQAGWYMHGQAGWYRGRPDRVMIRGSAPAAGLQTD